MIDLEKMRAVADGEDTDQLRVTKRWLRAALREIEAARNERAVGLLDLPQPQFR